MMVRSSLASRVFFGLLLLAGLVSCAPAAGPAAIPTAGALAAATPAPTTAVQPTATRLPLKVEVEQQQDGTSLVQDLGNYYEFKLSQEWLVIPVSRDRIDSVAKASPAPDAEFLRLAEKLYVNEKDAFRLIGLNMDGKFEKTGNPSLLLVTAIPDQISASMPMPELARMIQDTVFTDTLGKDVQRDVVLNANGINVAVVQGPYDYYSTQGATLRTLSKVLGFQANGRVILIQFITPEEFGSYLLPGIDAVIDTIKRINP